MFFLFSNREQRGLRVSRFCEWARLGLHLLVLVIFLFLFFLAICARLEA